MIRFFLHNVVAHPVAGLGWLLSDIAKALGLPVASACLSEAADWLHAVLGPN